MKNTILNLSRLAIILLAFNFSSCKKDDAGLVSQTVTIISSANTDGHIINSSPKTVKNTEQKLDMGWTGGAATRTFLSFDISTIIPSSDKKLVFDKVVLKVCEQNTNMLPFSGGGVTRVVEVYTLDYGTLDATDFDMPVIDNCGVITNTGYSVLKKYTLDVTQFSTNYIIKVLNSTKLQFRLQFTQNDNVDPNSSLAMAMWRLYSGEDQGSNYNEYRPVLEITYHSEKK